jgi:hypothetical protein
LAQLQKFQIDFEKEIKEKNKEIDKLLESHRRLRKYICSGEKDPG